MPILVKDFTWDESEEEVFLSVPLKGVKANKVDIYSCDAYVKISFPPFLFEVDFYKEIDELKSNATLGNGCVQFVFKKKDQVLWKQLKSDETPETLKERRRKAEDAVREREQELAKKKLEEKRQAEQFALKKQMELESAERERVAQIKEQEKLKAEEELNQWAAKTSDKAVDFESTTVKTSAPQTGKIKTAEKSAPIFENTGPRPTGRISVKFTPRIFPSAARESKLQEEEEYIERNIKRQQKVNQDQVDTNKPLEENIPVFLKDKGDQFFAAGDMESALNAYNEAFKLNNQIPSVLSNRAACYLRMERYKECIGDCTAALELLNPPVPANAKSRVKLLARRGAAYCALRDLTAACSDYEAALVIDGSNDQLKSDLSRLRAALCTAPEQ
eukprot:Colp12_sorted_trinity150504_noHs@2470